MSVSAPGTQAVHGGCLDAAVGVWWCGYIRGRIYTLDASDAVGRQIVARASARQFRSPLDHPVRARSWLGRCSTAISLNIAPMPGAPGDSRRRPRNDLSAWRSGSSPKLWRWLRVFIHSSRVVIGVLPLFSSVRFLSNPPSSAHRAVSAPPCKDGDPIGWLTSYHAQTAATGRSHFDGVILGRRFPPGHVMHVFETTVPVTLEMMILQGHSVCAARACAGVVDMPFGSLRASREQHFTLRGGRILKETIRRGQNSRAARDGRDPSRFLSDAAYPVGHIGLTPRKSINLSARFARRAARRQLEPIETSQGDFGGRVHSRGDRVVAAPLRGRSPDHRDPDLGSRQCGLRRAMVFGAWKTCWDCRRGQRRNSVRPTNAISRSDYRGRDRGLRQPTYARAPARVRKHVYETTA